MARFAWCGRERLGLLSISGTAMVLHSMRWNPIRNGEGYYLETRRPDSRQTVRDVSDD
ncbi:hypothetical protein [Streptomyces sp. NPDC055140]